MKVNRQKKELLRSINELDAKIKCEKAKIESDKQYLKDFYRRNTMAIVATLIPVFLIGWKSGKILQEKHALGKIAKFGLFTFFNLISNFPKLK